MKFGSSFLSFRVVLLLLFLQMNVVLLIIEGGLQPSRRRSLFTLASYMLIFSARAGNLPKLIPIVKASLTDKTVIFYTI